MKTHRLCSVIAKIIDWLSDAGGFVGGLLILLMSLAVGTEVFLRYVFNRPTLWSLETTTYMLIASAFLGAAYVMRLGAHIRVDFLVSRLVLKTRIIFEIVTLSLTLVFCGVLWWYGLEYAVHALVRHEVSESVLLFPLWIPRLSIPIGMFLLILQTMKVVFNRASLLLKVESPRVPIGRLSLQNPVVLVPFYFGMLAAEIWLLHINPAVGLVSVLFTLLFSGVPIAFGLGLTGCITPFFIGAGERALYHAALVSYGALDNFTLAALPLFIFAASILSRGKIGEQVYDLATKWVGHLPGGLAIASVLACGLFAAISGSSVGTAAAIGLIAIPAMIKRGYDKELAYGTLATSGTLGSMIPPSLGFILFGSITDVSVGQLFIGGVIPGIVEVACISILVLILCRGGRRHKPIPAATWKERFISFKGAFWAILGAFVVIGGIYSGIFTPTEAAGILVLYALLVGIFIIRTIRLRDMMVLLREGIRVSSMVLIIVVGALLFGHIVTLLQIPQKICLAIGRTEMHPWAVMILINLLVLVLGTVLEGASLILVTVPVVFPIIVALGFDPLWFGVVFIANGEVALITPPVGMNLFAIQGITQDKLSTVIRGALPFILLQIFNLVLVIAFPPMSTWLPNQMIK